MGIKVKLSWVILIIMCVSRIYDMFYIMRLKQKYQYKNVYESLKGMFYFDVSLRILRGFKINSKVVSRDVRGV